MNKFYKVMALSLITFQSSVVSAESAEPVMEPISKFVGISDALAANYTKLFNLKLKQEKARFKFEGPLGSKYSYLDRTPSETAKITFFEDSRDLLLAGDHIEAHMKQLHRASPLDLGLLFSDLEKKKEALHQLLDSKRQDALQASDEASRDDFVDGKPSARMEKASQLDEEVLKIAQEIAALELLKQNQDEMMRLSKRLEASKTAVSVKSDAEKDKGGKNGRRRGRRSAHAEKSDL